MNVIFHTLAAAATSVVVSSVIDQNGMHDWNTVKKAGASAAVVCAGVLLHEIMDVMPHSYPLSGKADVLFSLGIFAGVLLFLRKRYMFVFILCFFGNILPDLIDLGPAAVNKILSTNIPVVKIFPCHWQQFSGSIFDGSRASVSIFNHLVVLVSVLAVIILKREFICRQMIQQYLVRKRPS